MMSNYVEGVIMNEVWAVSDHHLDHANILNFVLDDGTKMRPFTTVEEMQETIIANHNERVKPNDKVYFLGDFVMHWRNLHLASRMNGKKRLVLGNHDPEWKAKWVKTDVGEMVRVSDYLKYFEEIYSSRLLDNILLTHIPVHPESLRVEWTNVHGHVHNNQPQGVLGTKYYNISIEMTDYKPLTLDEIKGRIRVQKERNQALVIGHLAAMGVSDLSMLDAEELEKL